jgi:hypothetical protein
MNSECCALADSGGSNPSKPIFVDSDDDAPSKRDNEKLALLVT